MPAAPFVTAVLLAAGSGNRIGGELPKQFLPLAGEPMFAHSLRVFQASARVGSIVLALPPDKGSWPPETAGGSKVVARVPGAASRQGSLRRALEHLPAQTEVVMVHDAARPLLTEDLIAGLLDALGDCDGSIAAVPLEDTIKRVSAEGFIAGALDRDGVWRVQTPQALRKQALLDALAQAVDAGVEATDCSHLLTRAGYRVRVVPGDSHNLKVTRPADLELAEALLELRRARADKGA